MYGLKPSLKRIEYLTGRALTISPMEAWLKTSGGSLDLMYSAAHYEMTELGSVNLGMAFHNTFICSWGLSSSKRLDHLFLS